MRAERGAALDWARIGAAVLVVCNHTSPLSSLTGSGDFFLTRVLARLAVPLFVMISGYFLEQSGWKSAHHLLKKTAVLYGAAAALYLPLNLYAGQLTPDFFRKILTDGTFYHLWYFPALLLGVPIAGWLRRLGFRTALAAAGVLYLIGIGGDSYYGLALQLPGAERLYGAVFHVFSYTRNGLFYMPLFLLLGAAGLRLPRRFAPVGTLAGLALMTAEAFWLRSLGVQRHDSMYLALPLVMTCLFAWLLAMNRGQRRELRALSAWVYLLHPWCIVLIRGIAGALGWDRWLVENSLFHFFAVVLVSFALSGLLLALRPQPLRPTARAWREVDLDALAHNAAVLRKCLSPGQELMAVVKADAYGHGAVGVARQLQRTGVRAFAVACLKEGITLRKAGVRGTILILGWTDPAQVPLLRRWHLTQAVVDEAHGHALAAQGQPVSVHLALDTGMHRLGVPAGDREALDRLFGEKNLRIRGVFSHLCVSDSLETGNAAYTRRQLEAFYKAVDGLRTAGYDPGAIHIQSSYGLLNLPPQPCRYLRAGIILYGIPSDNAPTASWPDLRPVLSLRARVASVRHLAPGEGAGYGLTFRAERETALAVVTIGYGDGLPRQLSQEGGEALIRGFRCSMVGRMCMDQLFLDVTEVPETRPGDMVTLIGRDGGQEITAQEVSGHCGTITNELLSRLGPRLNVMGVTGRSAGNKPIFADQ